MINSGAPFRWPFGREHLAHYKVPKVYLQTDALPKNASGKVQKFRLQDMVANA